MNTRMSCWCGGTGYARLRHSFARNGYSFAGVSLRCAACAVEISTAQFRRCVTKTDAARELSAAQQRGGTAILSGILNRQRKSPDFRRGFLKKNYFIVSIHGDRVC